MTSFISSEYGMLMTRPVFTVERERLVVVDEVAAVPHAGLG